MTRKLLLAGSGLLLLILIPILSVYLMPLKPVRPERFTSTLTENGMDSAFRELGTSVADTQPTLYADELSFNNLSVMEPVAFKNLQVYLICGDAQTDHKRYMALNEALKGGKVKVFETSDVNTLKISNNSPEYIYLNSGDIVKGGKQDRTIQYDVILPPFAQDIDLASFCVEHGRWSQRNDEADGFFSSSEKTLSSKELKLATRKSEDQSKVWEEVAVFQSNTSSNINAGRSESDYLDVTSTVSESSLQLTLENENITQLQEEYTKMMWTRLQSCPNAVGLAYFINGKLHGVDIYNNHKLFSDLFKKLFDAAVAEAISLGVKDSSVETNRAALVTGLFPANAHVYAEETVNSMTRLESAQHNRNNNLFIFTTWDEKEKKWLHRNWLME